MAEEKEGTEKIRMIHIRLPEETHKRLRVRVAELDTTIQDWVATLIQKVLDRVESTHG
jgi:plasmid stability protein